MPFTAKSGKFSANINTLTMGTGDKAIVLGGENVLPFYTFDAEIENAPKVGIEITDGGLEAEPECVKKYYEGCSTIVDMAKKAATFEGVDFLSIHLEGGDPNGENKPTEELINIVKEVADAVDLPIVVLKYSMEEMLLCLQQKKRTTKMSALQQVLLTSRS